jgi:hypothetical protein
MEEDYNHDSDLKLPQRLTFKLNNSIDKNDQVVTGEIRSNGSTHALLGILDVDVAPHLQNRATKEFNDAIESGIESIPPAVLHYLARGKWKFRLDESMSKDDPILAAKNAAGHGEGGRKFGTNFGATDFDGHRIVVAEKADPLNPNSHTYEADRINPHPDETLRHETGHALDAALGMYSHSNEFINAYNDCLKSLPPADLERLSYYLQKGHGGPQELFAELFDYLHGGGPNKGEIDGELARAFKPCLQKIKDLEVLMQKEHAS